MRTIARDWPLALVVLMARANARAGDRGDVPGWVLITVMTAGLVTAIWLVADDQLTGVLQRAIGTVSQP